MKKLSCVFCQWEQLAIILENDLAVGFKDIRPVSKGHLLIIPKRHRTNYFDLSEEELLAINELIHSGKELLDNQFAPDGYNIGVNVGTYGGQTVMHCHFHIIPRYIGDDPHPAGGIRKLLPKGQEKI
ncbi:MAG: HIT family protein [Liquorilactobacillus hordei]|uniref:HIT family protein n=1 Tax=Liquorilactobacillus hordei TaxID=468911 RepID=A0A3Q8CYC4_9LACO|nr:HIT family protein [Liquorilactobacillus hordei]AUJ30826.1 HIT family protein [Liquorilactobacillus hordei]